MLSALTNILTCPVCKNGVTVEGGTLCCLGGKHRFDLAREGYVNLAVGHAPGGIPSRRLPRGQAFCKRGIMPPLQLPWRRRCAIICLTVRC
jgi:hypothetical protein